MITILSICKVLCFYYLFYLCCDAVATSKGNTQALLTPIESALALRNVSAKLFYELEELSRIVDISYCVGTTGILKPFLCASRCQEFPDFELVTTWNTGPLLADSCGYIAIDHSPSSPRIIVAFRGTYSVANTIIDLSTVPQEYVPYPVNEGAKCENCTVHLGFMTAWRHTRAEILPHLEATKKKYPEHQLTLVGHSLGGAVAALAALEFKVRRWNPQVTTFGEPRMGNKYLMHYVDKAFSSKDSNESSAMYRRVTHIDDPVPLLPLKEWGYRMHAGEIYISKRDLAPDVGDLQHCEGDEDPDCIASGEATVKAAASADAKSWLEAEDVTETWNDDKGVLAFPARLKLWQLFFAHRDYFWRLGLCVPGGDPFNWHKGYPRNETETL